VGLSVDSQVKFHDINALFRYLETHGEVDDDWLSAWDEF